jgi:DNA replication initiation complex subunit (GINS family)
MLRGIKRKRGGNLSNMEDAITFDSVREAYRRERSSAVLQALNTDFYEKVLEYIARKKGELESARERGGRFGNKLVKHHETELENAIMTLHQLAELREKKILILALAQSKTLTKSDLKFTPIEKRFFNDVLGLINKKRSKIFKDEIPAIVDIALDEPVKEVEPPPKKIKDGLIQVEFLEDTSKFLGLDLKTYGPYQKGQHTELPKELIELLTSKGKAKIIE